MTTGKDNTIEAVRRAQLRDDLRQACEQTLDARVDRYLEIKHQGIIGGHHFAAASSECITLYRDGHFISAVMVSQAVNEGIMKFVAERNGVKRQKHTTMMAELQAKGIVSGECVSASTRIWKSFRNDVHHMNPGVAKVPFAEQAKQNLQDLSVVEGDVFGVDIHEGKLIPKKPKHWDIHKDGTSANFSEVGNIETPSKSVDSYVSNRADTA